MIVLDTCVLIWLASDPSKLSKVAADTIAAERKSSSAAIAGVSLYEVAWLFHNHRLQIATSLATALSEIEARFIVLPTTASIAQIAAELPSPYPSDPMDKIIGATALDAGCALITPDRLIRKSKAVPVIW